MNPYSRLSSFFTAWRSYISISIVIKQLTDIQTFKKKALQWALGFDAVCYLDSNGFKDKYSKFDALIAVGIKADITANAGNAFEQLTQFRQ